MRPFIFSINSQANDFSAMNLLDKIDISTLWMFYDKFLFVFRSAAFVPYTRIKTDGKVSFVASKPNVWNVGTIIGLFIFYKFYSIYKYIYLKVYNFEIQ